jgi:hypothetical protein
MNIGVLIYTYNRIDDAKINQEIIRNIWDRSNLFKNIKIVHSFNGEPEWYPKKYLEDELTTATNPGHFAGAANLIDAGYKIFQDKLSNIDYLIILAADTWLIKPEFVFKICNTLKNEHQYLAAASWSSSLPGEFRSIEKGASTDFCILDFQWSIKYHMFPMNYQEFFDKYGELFFYQGGVPSVEKLFLSKFIKAIFNQNKVDARLRYEAINKIHSITEREPIHTNRENAPVLRKLYWPEIGLITNHDPQDKQTILKENKIDCGPECHNLLTSTDLRNFNLGFIDLYDQIHFK